MVIHGGTVITTLELIKRDIRIENGRIAEMGTFTDFGEDAISAEGCYICPGFIDIHTHGGGGGDFMDASDESFDAALSFHAKNGTTSVFATSVTAPVEQIEGMLQKVREYKQCEHNGSRVLGAHIEGPFISNKNKGAQQEKYLKIPARSGYDFIIKNRDVCKRVTLSPELDGSAVMTDELVRAGVQVSGGHDNAEKKSIMAAVDAGMNSCTHWYCAMSKVEKRGVEREVGLVEIGLLDSRLYLELLADNHHLPPELIQLAYKCKGADRLCIVSDSLRAAGLPEDGKMYSLGLGGDAAAGRFQIKNGVAVMEDETHFAGSVQPVGNMVRNLVNDCGIPIADAVRMGSLTPARLMAVDKELGSVTVGKTADICVLDRKFDNLKTIIGGEIYK